MWDGYDERWVTEFPKECGSKLYITEKLLRSEYYAGAAAEYEQLY